MKKMNRYVIAITTLYMELDVWKDERTKDNSRDKDAAPCFSQYEYFERESKRRRRWGKKQ
jgi:hypothetical protein